MRRAILLSGFNNWGKSTHIRNIFHHKRFRLGNEYQIQNINASFIVECRSNDDLSEKPYIDAVNKRINNASNSSADVFCAFCPTSVVLHSVWNLSAR